MTDLTLEKLPQAVSQLYNKLEIIEQLLYDKSNDTLESDQLLTIQQAAEFLSLSVPTIYGYVQRKEIPVCKRSKRLYFSRQSLINWIKASYKKTKAEIESDTHQYLKNKKGGNYENR